MKILVNTVTYGILTSDLGIGGSQDIYYTQQSDDLVFDCTCHFVSSIRDVTTTAPTWEKKIIWSFTWGSKFAKTHQKHYRSTVPCKKPQHRLHHRLTKNTCFCSRWVPVLYMNYEYLFCIYITDTQALLLSKVNVCVCMVPDQCLAVALLQAYLHWHHRHHHPHVVFFQESWALSPLLLLQNSDNPLQGYQSRPWMTSPCHLPLFLPHTLHKALYTDLTEQDTEPTSHRVYFKLETAVRFTIFLNFTATLATNTLPMYASTQFWINCNQSDQVSLLLSSFSTRKGSWCLLQLCAFQSFSHSVLDQPSSRPVINFGAKHGPLNVRQALCRVITLEGRNWWTAPGFLTNRCSAPRKAAKSDSVVNLSKKWSTMIKTQAFLDANIKYWHL